MKQYEAKIAELESALQKAEELNVLQEKIIYAACKLLVIIKDSCPHDLYGFHYSRCEAGCIDSRHWWQCWKAYVLADAKVGE